MVVEVLQQFNYSGEVHADIPAQVAIRGGGQVNLVVKDGRILSCLVLNESGQKLYHDQQAYRLLGKLGRLDWELTPFSSPSPPATPAPTPPAFQPLTRQPVQTNYGQRSGYPRRQVTSQTQMDTWSMRHRSVYMLCDGTRSSEQIAVLLSRPRDIIERTLTDLRLSGAIEE